MYVPVLWIRRVISDTSNVVASYEPTRIELWLGCGGDVRLGLRIFPIRYFRGYLVVASGANRDLTYMGDSRIS
jgi:hypothetical protein